MKGDIAMGDPRTIATRELLQQLLAEVNETDPDMLPPPTKLDDGEKVIGILTDDYIKRMFSLAAFYRRESMRLQVDLEASGEDPIQNINYNQLKQKFETLQEIFWFLIRTHFAAWGMGVGIRRGWTFVNTDGSKGDKMPTLLRKILES
jgi:hypothetical protein